MHYEIEEALPMDDILESFVKALVSVPAEVEIEKTESQSTVIFSIDVLDEDRGKIIGRGGKIIESLKTLFSALGSKNGVRVHLEIKE